MVHVRQCSEFASNFEYASVLNMLRFWIYHSFQYVKVAQGSKYV